MSTHEELEEKARKALQEIRDQNERLADLLVAAAEAARRAVLEELGKPLSALTASYLASSAYHGTLISLSIVSQRWLRDSVKDARYLKDDDRPKEPAGDPPPPPPADQDENPPAPRRRRAPMPFVDDGTPEG